HPTPTLFPYTTLFRSREPVGHGDHHGLLQPQYVAEIGGKVAEHRQLRRARIAEDGREAEVAQQREHRLANGYAHGLHDAPTPILDRKSTRLNSSHLGI